MFKSRIAKVLAATVGVALIGAGGIAYSLWSTAGVGPGQAGALTAQSITVTAAAGAADLYPGGTAGAVHFTLTNPNPYPVTFTSMSAGTVTSSDPVACPASNVTVAGATGLSLTVGANATSSPQSIAGVVSMALAAPDGCQAKTFTVALTLAGSQ